MTQALLALPYMSKFSVLSSKFCNRIHPFRDGNGRMSRLLSLLLLYKNGFDAGKYISFEEQTNRRKEYYCEASRQSSTGWAEGKNSYFPFMEEFLFTLCLCYKELDVRFDVAQDKKAQGLELLAKSWRLCYHLAEATA